jgi:hypothetical protein
MNFITAFAGNIPKRFITADAPVSPCKTTMASPNDR